MLGTSNGNVQVCTPNFNLTLMEDVQQKSRLKRFLPVEVYMSKEDIK